MQGGPQGARAARPHEGCGWREDSYRLRLDEVQQLRLKRLKRLRHEECTVSVVSVVQDWFLLLVQVTDMRWALHSVILMRGSEVDSANAIPKLSFGTTFHAHAHARARAHTHTHTRTRTRTRTHTHIHSYQVRLGAPVGKRDALVEERRRKRKSIITRTT